jgi:hypothetical protein
MLRYFLLVSVCRASNACRLAVVSDIGSCNNEDTMSLAPEIASPTTICQRPQQSISYQLSCEVSEPSNHP